MKAIHDPAAVRFPIEMGRRNAVVTIYRREKRLAGDRVHVDYRVGSYDETGKRTFVCFTDFDAAVQAAEARFDALGRGIAEVLTLAGPARLDYLAATKGLPPGVTLVDLRNAWLREHQKPPIDPIRVPALVDAFIESRSKETRRGKPASDEYRTDLRLRLGKFAEAFPVDTAHLTGRKLQEWIDSTEQTGRNRFNMLRIVGKLLRWAQKRGHLPEGKLPTDGLDIRALTDDGPIETFEPQELERLLRGANAEMLPPRRHRGLCRSANGGGHAPRLVRRKAGARFHLGDRQHGEDQIASTGADPAGARGMAGAGQERSGPGCAVCLPEQANRLARP